jgi:hypothetical protein
VTEIYLCDAASRSRYGLRCGVRGVELLYGSWRHADVDHRPACGSAPPAPADYGSQSPELCCCLDAPTAAAINALPPPGPASHAPPPLRVGERLPADICLEVSQHGYLLSRRGRS